jgi:L-lactate dehydrogenase complex protein LldF
VCGRCTWPSFWHEGLSIVVEATPFRRQAAQTLADARLLQVLTAATGRFSNARKDAVAEVAEWEELREYARQVKAHTLSKLDDYLAELEARVVEQGGKIFWAPDAAAACNYVIGVATQHEPSPLVKSKSMTTEEIGLTEVMGRVGLQAVETDLGEFIVQLAGEGPYHIIAPAVHKTRQEVSALFERHLGAAGTDDIAALTRTARRALREKFAAAQIGITGANFAVAETGTICVVENEGNVRMCAALPRVHIVVMGIEKVIPRWEDLAVFLRLLPRAATGQKLTSYVSLFSGPRRSGECEGPEEFHLVLLDNGRTRILADPRTRATLACIRCGACLNVCPVYGKAGGHSYGSAYSGPIGAVLAPQMREAARAAELPFASSLCRACDEVCPAKIPLSELLLELRARLTRRPSRYAGARRKRFWLGLWAAAMKATWSYRLSGTLARWLLRARARDGWVESLPGPFAAWTKTRAFPAPAAKPFRTLWKERGK